MAQWVACLTSTQVMISQFVGSIPVSGSVLTDPALDSVSPSLAALPLTTPHPQLVLF